MWPVGHWCLMAEMLRDAAMSPSHPEPAWAQDIGTLSLAAQDISPHCHIETGFLVGWVYGISGLALSGPAPSHSRMVLSHAPTLEEHL